MDKKMEIAIIGYNKSKWILNEYFQHNFSNSNSNENEKKEESFSEIFETELEKQRKIKKLSNIIDESKENKS